MVTIRKTAKGVIVTQDGFSKCFRAFYKGANIYKVFVPCLLIKSYETLDENLAAQIAELVATKMNPTTCQYYRYDGVKVLERGVVQ